jgi:predicted nucleotidyltransferase
MEDAVGLRADSGRPARYIQSMNAPDINRSILRMHIAAIEAKYPIKIVGLLPRGAAAHIFDDDAVDFLADKKSGLSLLDLCKAEGELGEKLGRPVGIVLRSGLTGSEAEEFPALAEPL